MWTDLTTDAQLDDIKALSAKQPVVIFKHSTRCSISNMAHSRLQKLTDTHGAVFYYLDLLNYRPLSNRIAEEYSVHHESPQILLIVNGECVYDESHNGITVAELEEQIDSHKLTLA